MPRLLVGLAILLVWELVVRALAPAYVAKPTTVVMAIPRVITDPAFLSATGATLAAVAEGLAIALVAGTVDRPADGAQRRPSSAASGITSTASTPCR